MSSSGIGQVAPSYLDQLTCNVMLETSGTTLLFLSWQVERISNSHHHSSLFHRRQKAPSALHPPNLELYI